MAQHCPICKAEVEENSDYPYYICDACEDKITDRSGHKIIYNFEKSPKGFKAFYKNDSNKEYIYDICYIDGEELKVYPLERDNLPAGKAGIVIQPLNFIKYASRPEDPVQRLSLAQAMPYDPEKRRARKKQITIEKIVIPAGFVTLFSMIPPAFGFLILAKLKNGSWSTYLFYSLASLTCLVLSWLIIKNRVHKFSRASYFKQHSYTFFLMGIIGYFLIVYMSLKAS